MWRSWRPWRPRSFPDHTNSKLRPYYFSTDLSLLPLLRYPLHPQSPRCRRRYRRPRRAIRASHVDARPRDVRPASEFRGKMIRLPSSTADISARIDEIYRTESRRVFASLVRLVRDFDLAEEAL